MDEAKIKEYNRIAEEINKNSGPFRYDDILWPPMPGIYPDPERKFQEIRDLECRESDVFVCSFPKTGTNWTHEVLSMLLCQSTEYNLTNPSNTFLEVLSDKEKVKKMESPRLFITHVPFKYLPSQLRHGKGKIVYVQRNPKDVFVSYFNFYKSKATLGKEMKWEDFYEQTILGEESLYGSWFTYTKEWENELNNENILSVYYEDMKRDLAGSITMFAEWLNVSCTASFIQEVADKCEFDNLKKNRFDPTALLNQSDDKTSLFRKGQVGDWKNWFTVSQNERFDEFYKEKMKNSKLNFTYEL